MIKANEIRLGNWLYEGHFDAPVTVIEIYANDLWTSSDHGWKYDEELLNPIPLTPEILEKCGFVKTEHLLGSGDLKFPYTDWRLGKMVCNWSEGWKHIEIEYSGVGIEHRTHLCKAYSLHQLQNLIFALTGQELSITL